MISTIKAKAINHLPKFLVKYISKKIVDKYIDKYASVQVTGKENLFEVELPTLFICNHLSNSDGLILDRVLEDIRPTFVAGKKLSKNDVTNIGVNIIKTTEIEPNTADREGIKKIIELIKQGDSVVIFPEGTRSRNGSLIEAKKGVLLIGRMSGVPIIPIGIWGTEKLLPINKDNNMAEEVFSYAEVNVNIGNQYQLPERLSGQDKKQFDEYILEDMMIKIANLLPEKYRGVYANKKRMLES